MNLVYSVVDVVYLSSDEEEEEQKTRDSLLEKGNVEPRNEVQGEKKRKKKLPLYQYKLCLQVAGRRRGSPSKVTRRVRELASHVQEVGEPKDQTEAIISGQETVVNDFVKKLEVEEAEVRMEKITVSSKGAKTEVLMRRMMSLSCDVCHKTFDRQSRVQIHKTCHYKTSTGLKRKGSDDGKDLPVKCPICFFVSTQLFERSLCLSCECWTLSVHYLRKERVCNEQGTTKHDRIHSGL
jgi:hypothetical protein